MPRHYIQIQLLLKLNEKDIQTLSNSSNNSNTTLVKVKSLIFVVDLQHLLHSNTTLVKVKLHKIPELGSVFWIQIQLLLKLNMFMVKSPDEWKRIQIQLLLKLN